ncbi:hypothetical protein [Polaromonas sp.]|uniref:hypothetical protein n=1 Tax=Polaromonas sp. TaxID=1869339 RepID=UPI003BB48BBB
MSCTTPSSRHFHALAMALLATFSEMALSAQAEDAAAQKAKEEAACKQAVAKFEHAIDFMRETQGSTWTTAFREKKLPSSVEPSIMQKEGYCGLSKYLKDNKLI